MAEHDPRPPVPDTFFRSYSVALLYPLPPALDDDDRRRLTTALAELTEGSVELAEAVGDDRSERFRLLYRGQMSDTGEPPEWRLESRAERPADLDAAVAQSWWWQQGRRLAPEVRGALVVSDHRDSTLDGLSRLRRFRRVVAAVEVARPSLAILWSPSQQLVDPRELVAAVRDAPMDPLPGPVNVRYYRTAGGRIGEGEHSEGQGGDEEFLMDTLGLGAIGSTDLQCHFRGLEPDAVSQVLFETALYLLEKGPVIGEGDSVQGPGQADRWLARRRPALSPPTRDVLDLDPGFPFAAGE